jgi:hypothetical protein
MHSLAPLGLSRIKLSSFSLLPADIRSARRSEPSPILQTASSQPDSDIDLPPLYTEQAQIKAEARRFNVLCIGRRAGKTYLGMHLALEAALAAAPVGWFAPNYKYLLEVWQDLTRRLRPVADKINATERRIELKNGGLIECWTLDGTDDPGRSRKYKLAIIDEAAIAGNLKAAWEQAIRPTLTDLQGSAWFLSTPKGLNAFYDLYKLGVDPAFPSWQAWQMPSSVNPNLPEEEIEAAALELPQQVFQQEYLAQFLQNEGAVFRNVDRCLNAPETTPGAHAGHILVAGVDWGKSHDFTALSIVCCHCAAEVYLDRFNQIGWAFQRDRLLAALTRWGVKHARVERNSIGSPNLEALRAVAPDSLTITGFDTTLKSKAPLIQALALAFERESAQWLPDPVARHELIAYETKVTETGFVKYSAPEGGFDDTVIARALAWKAARPYLPPPLTDAERIERALPDGWKLENKPNAPDGSWEWDGWVLAREQAIAKIRKAEEHKNPDLDDPWKAAPPLGNSADNPWGDWERH